MKRVARRGRKRYSLAGELFPTSALGIRASYAGSHVDDTHDESYELAATWFFKRGIGARVALAKTRSGSGFQDVDAVSVQLIGRL